MHRGDTSPSGPTRRAVTTRTASGNMRTMNLDIWQMEVSDLSASESLSSVSTACNNNNRRISRRERIRDDSSKEAAAVENNKRIPRRDRKLNTAAAAAMDSSGTSAATPQVRIPRKDRRKARRRSPKQTNGAPIQPVDERHSTDAAPRLMRRTTIDTPLNITRGSSSKGSSSSNKSPTNSRTGPPLQRRATVDSATQPSQSITINITVRRRRRKSANQQQLPLNNQLPLHRHFTDASGSSHDNDNSTISTTPSLRRASTVEGALRRIVDTPPPLLRRSSTDFTNSKQPRVSNATAPCCQDHHHQQAPAKPMRRSSISQQQQYPVRRSGTDASDETSVTERDDEFYGKHVAVRELQPEQQQQASFRRSRTADSLPVIPQRRYSVVSSKKGTAADHRPAATVHSNSSLQRSLSFSENDCIHPSTSRWGTAR